MLAVVGEGSLSAAARALGLTQPTVGRQIDALEEQLARPLFTRSKNGLLPTDAALVLVPHAEAMAKAAEALVRTASGGVDEERGAVRVTASEHIGVELLAPLLPSFLAEHPRIAVELMLFEALLRRKKQLLPLSRDAYAFRCDSHLAQQAALRAGAGIGSSSWPMKSQRRRRHAASPGSAPTWATRQPLSTGCG
jgi:molybdenum-dependent DNA-binding transcriptional regulator ModE